MAFLQSLIFSLVPFFQFDILYPARNFSLYKQPCISPNNISVPSSPLLQQVPADQAVPRACTVAMRLGLHPQPATPQPPLRPLHSPPSPPPAFHATQSRPRLHLRHRQLLGPIHTSDRQNFVQYCALDDCACVCVRLNVLVFQCVVLCMCG